MPGKKFCSSIGEVRELENISAGSLNVLLCKFFMDVKKKDGGDYEPASLSSFQKSIQRCLKDKNSSFNLFQDMEFAKSRKVLLAKKRELVEKHDKGNRPQVVGSNTPSEEDLLFHSSSVTTTLRFYRERFGLCYRCTLDSELEMSPGS